MNTRTEELGPNAGLGQAQAGGRRPEVEAA
jgi:hypothetical protein